jgi:molecular chaperone GrpE (heat shock protein)
VRKPKNPRILKGGASGRPFDPQTMEAVEAVAGGEHSSGTVVEELCRAYLWRGRVH